MGAVRGSPHSSALALAPQCAMRPRKRSAPSQPGYQWAPSWPLASGICRSGCEPHAMLASSVDASFDWIHRTQPRYASGAPQSARARAGVTREHAFSACSRTTRASLACLMGSTLRLTLADKPFPTAHSLRQASRRCSELIGSLSAGWSCQSVVACRLCRVVWCPSSLTPLSSSFC